MLFLIFLTITLSVDSLCISFQYAITNKKLSQLHFFLMAITTYIFLLIAQKCLQLLPFSLSECWMDYVSIAIFLFLGASTFHSRTKKEDYDVDFNHSGTIQFLEAEVLSILLSIDSLVVLPTLPPSLQLQLLFPFCIAFFELLFLEIGNLLGHKLLINSQKENKFLNITKTVTALFFILLAIFRFFL